MSFTFSTIRHATPHHLKLFHSGNILRRNLGRHQLNNFNPHGIFRGFSQKCQTEPKKPLSSGTSRKEKWAEKCIKVLAYTAAIAAGIGEGLAPWIVLNCVINHKDKPKRS